MVWEANEASETLSLDLVWPCDTESLENKVHSTRVAEASGNVKGGWGGVRTDQN